MAALDPDATRTGEDISELPVDRPAASGRLAAPLQYRDKDRYDVLGEHGRGGLGRVARAHDKELGRDVAIKELIKRGDLGEVRFLREAMITARLEHPSIVPIHEAGRWPDGTPFYVMKLVAGRSLKELIEERPTIEQRLGLLHHVIAVADAMAYAHQRKIIHRDLKPGNVIAGDYGETIVIDWGLAKDLDQPEETSFVDGPYRTGGRDDLTVAGSVLGTPLYMAPEQARGESVDQRADVFAIGAMLWELCSLQRVPPPDPRDRERMLRKAGIDHDLIAIVAKALAADRTARYRDAGELAADLKAFTSGARIAARSYSLFAMLAHWIRRHRAVSASIGVAAVLAIIGMAVYVRNIGAARDTAEASQRDAEEARGTVLLENAELLMGRDPTAAMETLAKYRGSDRVREQRLLAEARGRGVAEKLTPHSDSIWFVHRDASRAVLTLGEDRKIRITEGGVATTLAGDVTLMSPAAFAFAPQPRLLAYAATPHGVSILDVGARTTKRLSDLDPMLLDIARDGSRLAALDRANELTVWDLSSGEIVMKERIPAIQRMTFLDRSTLLIVEKEAIEARSLTDARSSRFDNRAVIRAYDLRADAIVLADKGGKVTWLSSTLEPLASAQPCTGKIYNLRLVAGGPMVAFACSEGLAGILRYDAPLKQLALVDSVSFGVPVFDAIPDAAGQRLVAVVDSKTIHVYDLRAKLLTSYQGQPTDIRAVELSADQRHILVGDEDGELRIWPMPEHAARVVLRVQDRVLGGAVSPDSTTLVTDSIMGNVRRIDLRSGRVDTLAGHTAMVQRTRYARDGRSFLSFSHDGTARIWTSGGDRPLRIFAEHRGPVHDADYLDDGRRVVSVGDDGKLLRWSTDGDDAGVLFAHTSSLEALEVLAQNQHVVVHDAAGSVWDVAPDGKATPVGPKAGGTISLLRASQDGRLLAIGRGTGEVAVYETATYRIVLADQLSKSVRCIELDPKNRDVAVVSDGGELLVRPLGAERRLPWQRLALGVRDVAYRPDGESLAFVGSEGQAWFYSIRDERWTFVRDHAKSVSSGRFSRDGRWFVSTDPTGTVVVRDMHNPGSRKHP